MLCFLSLTIPFIITALCQSFPPLCASSIHASPARRQGPAPGCSLSSIRFPRLRAHFVPLNTLITLFLLGSQPFHSELLERRPSKLVLLPDRLSLLSLGGASLSAPPAPGTLCPSLTPAFSCSLPGSGPRPLSRLQLALGASAQEGSGPSCPPGPAGLELFACNPCVWRTVWPNRTWP